MTHTLRRLLFALAGGLLTACEGDVHESPIPYLATIRYTCNIETINAIAQQTSGQPALMSLGGYVRIYDPHILTASDIISHAGLLLVHSPIEAGTFYAFDLACPACYRQGFTSGDAHRLDMLDDGLTASCPTCSSAFGAVMWGSPAPTAGPANADNLPLRQYHASLLADGYTLVVSK